MEHFLTGPSLGFTFLVLVLVLVLVGLIFNSRDSPMKVHYVYQYGYAYGHIVAVARVSLASGAQVTRRRRRRHRAVVATQENVTRRRFLSPSIHSRFHLTREPSEPPACTVWLFAHSVPVVYARGAQGDDDDQYDTATITTLQAGAYTRPLLTSTRANFGH